MTDRTVMVQLKADTANYKRGMSDASRATMNYKHEIDKIEYAHSLAQKSADKWRTIGRATTIAGAAVGVAMLAATKAASDQEQAMGSLGAVFKSNTAIMEKNAAGATKIGLSQTQYAESAAQLGAQLGNLGIDQVDLASTTDDLITVAADMAAQFGGSTSDAVASLSSLMRGERDPIEKYGVTINEASLKAEMAATGFSKVEATLSLLNKQLTQSNTIGAMAREYDTTAAATQRMAAEAKDASAAFGEALLPAMSAAAGAAAKVLGAFNSLPGPLKTVTTFVVGIGTAALVVGPRLVQMKLAMDSAAMSGIAMSGAMGKLAEGISLLAKGGIVATVIASLWAVGDAIRGWQFGDATKNMDLLEAQITRFAARGSADIGKFGDEFADIVDSIADIHTGDVLGVWAPPWEGWDFNAMVDEIDQVDTKLSEMAAASDESAVTAAAFFEKVTEAAVDEGVAIEDVTGMFPQYTAAVEAARVATENGTAADADAARAKAELAAKVDALVANLMSLVQINLAMIGSQDALIGQEGRLGDAFDKNKAALQGRSEAAAANRAAMAHEVSLISALADATYKRVAAVEGEPAALEASNRVMSKHIGRLRENAIAADMSKESVDAFISKVGAIPGSKKTVFEQPGLTKGTGDVKDHFNAIDALPGFAKTLVSVPGTTTSTSQVKTHFDALKTLPPFARTLVTAPGAAQASSDVWGLRNAISGLVGKTVYVGVTGPGISASGKASVGVTGATGGLVRGPGTTTSDSILARLSNREFVMRAAAVEKYGSGYMTKLNAGQIDPRTLPKFARGGSVRRARREQRANNRWFRSLIRGRPWADEKWRDYNPTPEAKLRPTKSKKVESWRQELAREKRSWRDTVRRENLDWKWSRRDEAARRRESLDSDRERAAGGVRGSASVGGFDVRGAQSAEDSFQSALGAVGAAGSPEARARAVQVAREAGVKAMQSAVTPANVTKWMAGKLKTLVDFNVVLGQLAAKGLHPVTLAEVASMSPEDGLEMGRALLGADLSKINAMQAHINRTSAYYGVQQTAREAKSASNLAWYAGRAAGGAAGTSVSQVNVYLDSEQIAAGQQRLDQRLGVAA